MSISSVTNACFQCSHPALHLHDGGVQISAHSWRPLASTPLPLPGSPRQPVPRILGSPPLKYLFSTYRVGMLALETLARRVHDDRATKYSPTPPYGDDVMWLMRVAMKLGTTEECWCLCSPREMTFKTDFECAPHNSTCLMLLRPSLAAIERDFSV